MLNSTFAGAVRFRRFRYGYDIGLSIPIKFISPLKNTSVGCCSCKCHAQKTRKFLSIWKDSGFKGLQSVVDRFARAGWLNSDFPGKNSDIGLDITKPRPSQIEV